MSKKKNQLMQPGKTNLENAGLKGRVKQVNQICYKAFRSGIHVKKGKIDEVSYRSQTFSEWYNEKGMKTEAKIYHTGGWYKHQFWNGNEEPIEEVSWMPTCLRNGLVSGIISASPPRSVKFML
jgi:hypothetical protein